MKSGRPASSVRSAQAQKKRYRAKATAHDSASARVETPPTSPTSLSDAVDADASDTNTDQASGPSSHHPLPAVTDWPPPTADVPPTSTSASDKTRAAHPSGAATSVNIAELKRKSMKELHD